MVLSLSEAYKEYVRKGPVYQNPYSDVLWEAIRLALNPFKPKNVTLSVSERLYVWGLTLDVTFGTCDFLDFQLHIPETALSLVLNDPERIYSDLAERVYEHLISRPRVEPEANIVLGDN